MGKWGGGRGNSQNMHGSLSKCLYILVYVLKAKVLFRPGDGARNELRVFVILLTLCGVVRYGTLYFSNIPVTVPSLKFTFIPGKSTKIP